MTDIRERVARAIIKARTPWVKDANLRDISMYTMELAAADAALLACGYAEMREALEELVRASTDAEENPNDGACWSGFANAIAAARSLLNRTVEK